MRSCVASHSGVESSELPFSCINWRASDRDPRGSPRFPALEEATDDYCACAECNEGHCVPDEIESTLHRRHENLLAVHGLERRENLLRTVTARHQAHHVGVHCWGYAAGEIRRAA